MDITYSVYCDESCHLENDGQKVMALGSTWCPESSSRLITHRLKEIKRKHGLSEHFEIKWTKVSSGKLSFYLDVIDYYFDNTEISFRGLVVPDKSLLDHDSWNQTHDDWYYKMYFELIKIILNNDDHYKIYLDIKDTRGGAKVRKLHNVLSNSRYDFQRRIIKSINQIRSHESGMIQLTDLILGALMYANRGEYASDAKRAIVERIIERSGYSLTKNTLASEDKLNVFIWRANGD